MQINLTQKLILSTLGLFLNLVDASAMNLSTRVASSCNLSFTISKTQILLFKQINAISVSSAKKDFNKETFYNSINDDG